MATGTNWEGTVIKHFHSDQPRKFHRKFRIEISLKILGKYNQVKEIDFDVSNFKNFVDGFNTPEEKTMSVVFYIMFVVGGIANALGGFSKILLIQQPTKANATI